MRYVLQVAGNWFYEAIFLHPGHECPCYVRKILGFHLNGYCKHCFLAASAGLWNWVGTYQLQEIAWNLDISRVEVEWNLPCHRTSCCFFFLNLFPSLCLNRKLILFKTCQSLNSVEYTPAHTPFRRRKCIDLRPPQTAVLVQSYPCTGWLSWHLSSNSPRPSCHRETQERKGVTLKSL